MYKGPLRHYLIHFNPLAVAVGNHAFADVQVLRYVRGFGCLAGKSEAVVNVLEGSLYFGFRVKAADGKLSLTFQYDWGLAALVVICSLDLGDVEIQVGKLLIAQHAVPFVITLVDERVLKNDAVVLRTRVAEVRIALEAVFSGAE